MSAPGPSHARLSDDDVARTRAFWMANKPGETAAPGYLPDPPLWWHVALALVVSLVVQASFAPFLAFHGATISFVLLVVAWYGVRSGVARGFALGLLAGACEDALGGGTGVAWTFATGIAGACAGRVARTWLADTKLALVPGIAVLTFARFVLFAIGMKLQGRPLDLIALHAHAALWQSALDAGVAYVLLAYVPAIGGVPAYRR